MVCTFPTLLKSFLIKIVAAFQGMHVSPAKHSYAWLPRKCDYWTDRQTPDKVIPMCHCGSQARQYIVFIKIIQRICVSLLHPLHITSLNILQQTILSTFLLLSTSFLLRRLCIFGRHYEKGRHKTTQIPCTAFFVIAQHTLSQLLLLYCFLCDCTTHTVTTFAIK